MKNLIVLDSYKILRRKKSLQGLSSKMISIIAYLDRYYRVEDYSISVCITNVYIKILFLY